MGFGLQQNFLAEKKSARTTKDKKVQQGRFFAGCTGGDARAYIKLK
jgi:hypothetical protein